MAQNAVLIRPIVRLATLKTAQLYGTTGHTCRFEPVAHCVGPHGQYVSGLVNLVMRADAGGTRARVYRLKIMAAGVVPADQALSAHNP